MSELTTLDRIRGALLGGSVGDALGAGIEFLTLGEIRSRFGPEGLRDYALAYGRRGAITDDTQMTLFTAEGLIRAWVRQQERGICHKPSVVHHAYLRWLLTQGEQPTRRQIKIGTDGWLFSAQALHSRRAPGNTCIDGLRHAEGIGMPSVAYNNSKGCGRVMRVAPIGLLAPPLGDHEAVFTLATDVAALTHGHPTGSLAAGYLVTTIASLMSGLPLDGALQAADEVLHRRPHNDEVVTAIGAARGLAARGAPSAERIESLGAGWVAEEALAIAIYAALVATDFATGVLLAVNHSGDSDSTGSIGGNLLGAQHGLKAIPSRWLEELELCNEIERIAVDLDALAAGRMSSEQAWTDYPGW